MAAICTMSTNESMSFFDSIEADLSFLLLTIGFFSKLDIVMVSESRPTIDTVLLGLFFKWPRVVQGQTIYFSTK